MFLCKISVLYDVTWWQGTWILTKFSVPPKRYISRTVFFTSNILIFQSLLPFRFHNSKLNEATEQHFEKQNVSLTVVPLKSDKPIVRLPKKFQLSGSWGKFARLGYLGTSRVSSSEANVTTCSRGERVRSLALAENILYLKGRSQHVIFISNM